MDSLYLGKMGQNQTLDMADEERTELSIGLLREWWISATVSLVNEVGSDEALNHLKPYFYNTGSAGGQNIPRIIGAKENDISEYHIGIHMWPMVTGGRISGVFIAEDSQIFEYVECATNGSSKEGCICMCQYTWQASLNVTNPGHDLLLVRSLSYGDPVCHILTRITGKTAEVANTNEFRIPNDQLPPLLDKDVWIYLAHAYVGECWSNCTRAFVDAVGFDKALSNLKLQMRSSGRSFVERMDGRFGAREDRCQYILDIIDLVQTLHQKKGAINSKEGKVECSIMDCPFSSLPIEICIQYEAFFNGVCEAIDPNYEFAYDRMMTKGDKTCHWTIRKKGDAGKAKEMASSDDLAKQLGQKYINGEITEEEFDKKMANLRKHGLVK